MADDWWCWLIEEFILKDLERLGGPETRWFGHLGLGYGSLCGTRASCTTKLFCLKLAVCGAGLVV